MRYPSGEAEARVGVLEGPDGFRVVATIQLELVSGLRDLRTAERSALARVHGHIAGI